MINFEYSILMHRVREAQQCKFFCSTEYDSSGHCLSEQASLHCDQLHPWSSGAAGGVITPCAAGSTQEAGGRTFTLQ